MNKNTGYTLVEAMVAITILAIAMLFGMSFFVYGNRAGFRAEHYTTALQVAKNALESAQATPYDALLATPAETHAVNAGGIVYTSARQALEVDNAAERYKVVTVTVTWQDAYAPVRSLSLNTVVAP